MPGEKADEGRERRARTGHRGLAQAHRVQSMDEQGTFRKLQFNTTEEKKNETE